MGFLPHYWYCLLNRNKISEQGQGRGLSAEKEKQGIYVNEPPKLDYPKPVKNVNSLKILLNLEDSFYSNCKQFEDL